MPLADCSIILRANFFSILWKVYFFQRLASYVNLLRKAYLKGDQASYVLKHICLDMQMHIRWGSSNCDENLAQQIRVVREFGLVSCEKDLHLNGLILLQALQQLNFVSLSFISQVYSRHQLSDDCVILIRCSSFKQATFERGSIWVFKFLRWLTRLFQKHIWACEPLLEFTTVNGYRLTLL